MALTATATKSTRRIVIQRLCMENPVIVYLPPTKSNITYTVFAKPELVKEMIQPIVDDLKTKGKQAGKVLIYCRRHEEVAMMYECFQKIMQNRMLFPPGAPNLSKYRMVDMYSKCTDTGLRELIVTRFVDPTSVLRVVIATIAFGMGLDCPCVRKIIHWGPADDIDSYVQQTGRGGRDGKISSAVLYYTPRDKRFTSNNMIHYCENSTECRRKLLFMDFDDYTLSTPPPTKCCCCDICYKDCTCGSCESLL